MVYTGYRIMNRIKCHARSVYTRSFGQEIVFLIRKLHTMPTNAPFLAEINSATSSAAYFNILLNHDYATSINAQKNMLVEFSSYISKVSDSSDELTLADNIWNVAKNIPLDAPPNFIVLATRNVDPTSLRTRLQEEDMNKHISFIADSSWLLQNCAILVRLDRSSLVVPIGKRTSRFHLLSYIYGNSQFDMTTHDIRYLTSTDETVPYNN